MFTYNRQVINKSENFGKFKNLYILKIINISILYGVAYLRLFTNISDI